MPRSSQFHPIMESIEQLIPHRPPFLFVDEIVADGTDTLTTRRRVRPDEDFFKGHYPGNPIMPGVLLCEAVFQSGCAILAADGGNEGGPAPLHPGACAHHRRPVQSIVKPGDELIIDVKLKERLGRFMFLSGSVRTADNRKVLTVNLASRPGKEAPSNGGRSLTRRNPPHELSRRWRERPSSFSAWPTEERRLGRRPNPRGGGGAGRLQRPLGGAAEVAGGASAEPACLRVRRRAGGRRGPARRGGRAGDGPLHGIVHSIAFANYAEGIKPFHETRGRTSCRRRRSPASRWSRSPAPSSRTWRRDASVVTIGISSLLVTPDNYGYMGPIKAALESTARFLAKSFSADTRGALQRGRAPGRSRPAPRPAFRAIWRATSTRRS